MIFPGTLALNMALAPEARKLWFVFFAIPASAHMSFTIVDREFLPTGTSLYHGASGSGEVNFSAVNKGYHCQSILG